jgi:GrpB-like predicted nucleotidyltransferase (UPF0157 family)
LLQLLRPWLTSEVEHVGSTAVLGLPAKPIIDLTAPIASFDDAATIAAVMAPRGWHHVPPKLDGRPWRRFFVLVEDERRAAHLHLLLLDDPRRAEMVTFATGCAASLHSLRSTAG